MPNRADLTHRSATFAYMDGEDYTPYHLDGDAIADEALFMTEQTESLQVIVLEEQQSASCCRLPWNWKLPSVNHWWKVTPPRHALSQAACYVPGALTDCGRLLAVGISLALAVHFPSLSAQCKTLPTA